MYVKVVSKSGILLALLSTNGDAHNHEELLAS